MRAPPPLAHLAHDAAGHVVAREQLGRAAGVPVALGVAPAFLRGVGGLVPVVRGDVVEHEPLAVPVEQHPALAAHPLGDQDPAYAGRPDHARWMELDELHVLQVGARLVGEGLPVPGVLPAVAGDPEGTADAAGRHYDRPGPEEPEAAPLPVVAEGAHHPVTVLEEGDDGDLHVHVDPLMDPVVLEGADHLEPGAVAHVREARIAVAPEVALQDAPVLRPVEQRAPRLELAHPVRRLAGVQLGHAPVVDVLAAAHRIAEVDAPVVAVVHVPERRGDASFRHHGVGLAEERLADEADGHPGGGRLDRGAEPGAAGPDDEHVVIVRLVVGHRVVVPVTRSSSR